MGEKILNGVIAIIVVAILLVGLFYVGDYMVYKFDKKMTDHRQKIVEEIDRVVKTNIQGINLDEKVINALRNKEVQKAAEEFLSHLYYSEALGNIKGQINNKVNHGLWTFLGAVEGIYGLRPAYVDFLEKIYGKDQYFPVDAGYSVAPSQYKFHFIEGAKAKMEVEAKTKKGEVSEEPKAPSPPTGLRITPESEETEIKSEPEKAPIQETPASAPVPDNSALEETQGLLEQLK